MRVDGASALPNGAVAIGAGKRKSAWMILREAPMSETLEPGLQGFIEVAAAYRFLRGGMACRVSDAAGRVTVKALEKIGRASCRERV